MFERIWIAGDIHGSDLPIYNFYHRNKDTFTFSENTDCIILLGDVGANYYLDYRDKNFKKKLSKYPFTYFCIRGNHEARAQSCALKNADHWNLELFFEGAVWVEEQYPNIKYAIDYPFIYYILGYRTLVIPGAYSVDKQHRLKNGWSWFKDEQLTQDEMNIGRELIETDPNFDLVLSHTCPIYYEPTHLFLPMIDQSTVDKTMERYLGEIEFKIKYKRWLWAHFHSFLKYPVTEDGSLRIMLSAGKEAINLEDLMNNNIKKY